MYRKDQLDKLQNHFQEYMLFSSTMLGEVIKLIENNDEELAVKIIEEFEPKSNNFELAIEEEAISFLALNQAEASILRTIIMIIKMNNDLERICDNMAKLASSVFKQIENKYMNNGLKQQLEIMASKTQIMLKDINYAFLNRDINLCEKILANDDEIDDLHKSIYRDTISEIVKNPEKSNQIILYRRMSKSLERTADLITNMAEDIIFLITGKDIRHQPIDQ